MNKRYSSWKWVFGFILLAVVTMANLIEATDRGIPASGGDSSGRRVALVIGNSAYQHATPLPNPGNDARAVATKLRAIGFDVVSGIDLDKVGMEKTIRTFAGKLPGTQVGLFFYAGHGLQVKGQNYLVPIDAQLKEEVDLRFEAVPFNLVMEQMEREERVNLVFLDACRNNPLAGNLARSMGVTRSAAQGQGLAQEQAGVGSLITYATQPGNVAEDGKGSHSPFTEAFLTYMDKPGLELNSMLMSVRNQVIDNTGGKQVPWSHSSMRTPFWFVPGPPDGRPTAIPVQPASVVSPPNPRGQAVTLLAVCRDMLAGNYLTSPETRSGQPPQNALDCFKNVRSLDPGNREAIQGLGEIEKRYKELAESAISKGEEEKARTYIGRIRKVNPESLVAMELEDRLRGKARAEREAAARHQAKADARRQAAPPVSYAVTIQTTPSDASVEFTNINREYKDGVQLESGRYDLKVSRQGYKTFTGYVTVEKDSVWTVELESEQKVDIPRQAEASKKSSQAKKQHGQFVDNGNGTVTHTATGLILLKNANCFGVKTWDVAKSSAASLKSGSCGLTDGSVAGDWRLPTFPGTTRGFLNGDTPSIVGQAGELEILWAAKSNPAFTGVQAYNYWSSTTFANYTSSAWFVSLSNGFVYGFVKTNSLYVWPVRGGH